MFKNVKVDIIKKKVIIKVRKFWKIFKAEKPEKIDKKRLIYIFWGQWDDYRNIKDLVFISQLVLIAN